jgi:hypothetical protein
MRHLIILSILALVITLPAFGETYIVRPDGSGDLPTIQAAVDAADDGDLILLMNGVFQGEGNRNINVSDKDIAIRSQWVDPTLCTIDCAGGGALVHGFWFDEGEYSPRLEGVTITNARSCGIRIYGGTPVIRRCILRGNSGHQGGGIYTDFDCHPLISYCTFAENTAVAAGGGLCI